MFALPFQLTFTVREYTIIIIIEVIECCIMYLYSGYDARCFASETKKAPRLKTSCTLTDNFMRSAVWSCIILDMLIIMSQFNARFGIEEKNPLLFRGFFALVHYFIIVMLILDVYNLIRLKRLDRSSIYTGAKYVDIIENCLSDNYGDEAKTITNEFMVLILVNRRRINMVSVIVVFDLIYLILEWLMYGYIL